MSKLKNSNATFFFVIFKHCARTQINEIYCASFCTLRHGQSQWVKNQFLSHKNCIGNFLNSFSRQNETFPRENEIFLVPNSFTLSETFGADFQPLCLMVKDFSLLLVSWCKKQKKVEKSTTRERAHYAPQSRKLCS